MHRLYEIRSLGVILLFLIPALLLSFCWKDGSTTPFTPRRALKQNSAIADPSSSSNGIALPFGRHESYLVNSSSPHNTHLFQKRAPDFNTVKCHGADLYEKIKAARQGQVAPGPIFQAITNNGWSMNILPLEDNQGSLWPGFFRDKFHGRLPPTRSENLLIELKQDKPFKNAKGQWVETAESSGGRYLVNYLPAFSTIVATNTRSPRSQLLTDYKNDISEELILELMPPMNRFSDAIWTTWSGIANPPSSLRYIGRDTITNDDTTAIITYIFSQKSPSKQPLNWPGLTFTLDQDEGLALLGTQNGVGIAWVLIDRARDLGPRSVAVTVWAPAPGFPIYNMLFDMRPV